MRVCLRECIMCASNITSVCENSKRLLDRRYSSCCVVCGAAAGGSGETRAIPCCTSHTLSLFPLFDDKSAARSKVDALNFYD